MKTLASFFIFAFAIGVMVATEQFFPSGSMSEIEQNWYGKHLAAMGEPILKPDRTNDAYFAFRVLYLPTWGRPVVVRYWGSGTNFFRRSVMLSGNGGYEPGAIKQHSQIEVTKDEIDRLLSDLNKMKFWTIPPKDAVQGLDGSQLILEGVKGREHKIFTRWTPEVEPKKRNLGEVVKFYRELFERVDLVEKPASKQE